MCPCSPLPAPAHAQVQLISSTLRRSAFAAAVSVEVKSVDGYQGREKDVIVFSAVRSNPQGQVRAAVQTPVFM